MFCFTRKDFIHSFIHAMESAKAQLDFKNFTATFFDQVVDMYKVGTGHFCINLASKYLDTHINDVSERDIEIENVLAAVVEVRKNDIKKLHHVYGHVAAGKLKHFLEKAGFGSKEITQSIDEISNTCDACIKTKRRNPRPKSALPRVEGPNEIITVDLKEFDSHSDKHRYICYLIDMHSRMTIGDFISEKKPEKVIDVVMRRWIQTFGMMKCLHSDIGGEMSNELMENVASYLGVKLTTTCASSPHQNGINERNHATVDLMMTRMLESDRNLTPRMALSWALNAKNSLENCYGFSPFQLHIGYNPMLPNGTREGPPAMEGVTKSKTFSLHLNAIHAAREAFAHAESSSALKKALKTLKVMILKVGIGYITKKMKTSRTTRGGKDHHK